MYTVAAGNLPTATRKARQLYNHVNTLHCLCQVIKSYSVKFVIPSLVFSELSTDFSDATHINGVVVSTYLGAYDKVQQSANNEHLQ